MKRLLATLSIILSAQLAGCATAPMMKKENNNKVVNFFLVKLTNDQKITDKKINLRFEVNPKVKLGGFDYKKFKSDITNGLTSKGVELASSGRKVVIKVAFRCMG